MCLYRYCLLDKLQIFSCLANLRIQPTHFTIVIANVTYGKHSIASNYGQFNYDKRNTANETEPSRTTGKFFLS